MVIYKLGDSGAEVKKIKDRLVALGYLNASTHDRFGNDTEHAVRLFQRDNNLKIDGIVGAKTWLELFDKEVSPQLYPSQKFVKEILSKVGNSIYVWGANGEVLTSMAAPKTWIKKRETSTRNYDRAVALFEKLKKAKIKPIQAFDCSGLVYYCLKQINADKGDMTANTMWLNCKLRNDTGLTKDELRPGDFIYHHDGKKITHIGVVVDKLNSVECIGRDDGVVKLPLNGRLGSYWNRWSRWDTFANEPAVEMVSKFISGDVNKDGKFNIADVTKTLQYIAELVEFDEEQKQAADFNEDGKIDLKDVIGMLNSLI